MFGEVAYSLYLKVKEVKLSSIQGHSCKDSQDAWNMHMYIKNLGVEKLSISKYLHLGSSNH